MMEAYLSVRRTKTYLALVVDGTEAVEELEGRDDLALDQNAGDDCSRGPPARAGRHLKEPLLERYLS